MTELPDYRGHAEHGLMKGYPPPREKVVTAANGLWVPPYNRWAYQHMRRLLPSVPIARAATPRELARVRNTAVDDLHVTTPDELEMSLAEFLRSSYTDAMVVIHDDTIVWEHYDNGMTSSTPHQMMSCTKSLIGLFALNAIHAGLAAESDRVDDHIEELAESGFADASLGQILDMTNSLVFDETYDDPKADIHTYAAIVGLGESASEIGSDSLYEYLATLHGDSEIEHGSVFRYQTPKTDVVNWVTNRLTHRSLFDDLDQLWSVIGGGDEAYVLVDRTGAPVAGGGLNASPEDLARFCAFVLADTGDLISTAVLNRIQSGGSVDAFLAGPDALGVMTDGNWTYRAQWWVRNESGREAMTAIGVNGQWVYLDRKRGVGIVKQSSQPVAVDEQIDDLTIGVFDRIIDLVG